jgi:hypothetical protein
MPSGDRVPFVRLATLGDRAAADLCAAMLRSAGMESRLRGESLGPYRLTIGAMAATEVWVPAAELEEARAVVEAAGLPADAVIAADSAPEAPSGEAWRWWPLVALGLLALLAWGLLSRLF